MNPLRLHITALLIALMTLTGFGTAMAKGMPQSVGMIELCSGQHTILVAVDANGEPTVPQHHCLDCTLLALDMLASDVDQLTASKTIFTAPKPAAVVAVSAQKILRLNARAPPVSV